MVTLFAQFLSPLSAYLDSESKEIDQNTGSRSFYYSDFICTLIYGISLKIPSLRKLCLDLQTQPDINKLDLKPIAFSTLKDGFSRFNYLLVNKLYVYLLSTIPFQKVPYLKDIGLVKLVDGSLFPTLSSVDWAGYKKHKKAIRLHLSFCLNTLCPSQFLVDKGSSCERSFLKSIIERGETYIADRGYFSFDLAYCIDKARAFFIFRLKDNLIFDAFINLDPTTEGQTMPACFKNVRDDIIYFVNDPNKIVYRLIRFQVLNSHFAICTNRFDLDTLKIIMLYAYRWQVELFFKFIKRTLNGIHLFSTSKNGAQCHFLLILITTLLQLKLKQDCADKMKIAQEQEKNKKNNDFNFYSQHDPSKWIKDIAQIFENEFKITSDWLLFFKNRIAQCIDNQTIKYLATG
jgi:hypothetical protein